MTLSVALAAAASGLVAAAPATLAATAPTLSSFGSVGVGAVGYNLTVTGANLLPNASVSFYTPSNLPYASTTVSPDITVAGTPTASADGKTLTVPVNVVSTASVEKVDISVQNSGGSATNCYAFSLTAPTDTGCVSIDAPPSSIAFTSPIGAGAIGHATPFTATGLQPGSASLIFPTNSGLSEAAPVTLASGAKGASPLLSSTGTAAATVPVTLVNGDGGRGTANLTVDAPPVITSISNPSPIDGRDYTTTITGTGFSTTTTPGVVLAGVASGKVATGSTATSLTVDFGTIGASYPAGPVSLAVNNADGGTFSSTALASVISAPGQLANIGVSAVGDGTATISWNYETFDGGSAITGYTVTTTPDTGPHAVPAGLNSVTLTGLTDTATYTASVTATNTVGLTSSPATSASFAPAPPPAPVVTVTTVSLKGSAKQVAYAKSVSFSGNVSNGGLPVAGVAVTLNTKGTNGELLGTGDLAITDALGNFTFPKQYPAENVTYVATLGATLSNGVPVTVVQYLQLAKPAITKNKISFSGLATPGSSARKVTVRLFKVTKSGHRVGTVASIALGKSKTKSGYPFGASVVSISAKLKPGKYLLAVAILGTPTNAPVQSKVFSVTIK